VSKYENATSLNPILLNKAYLYGKINYLILRLAHITLALLLFISSTGFVVNKHYCKNELKSMALFVKAEGCSMHQVMKACPIHGQMLVDVSDEERKGCCDDTTEIVKIDEEQIAPSFDLLPLQAVQFAPLFVAHKIELPVIDIQTLHYLNYKPPPLLCDFPISLQTFRC